MIYRQRVVFWYGINANRGKTFHKWKLHGHHTSCRHNYSNMTTAPVTRFTQHKNRLHYIGGFFQSMRNKGKWLLIRTSVPGVAELQLMN